jgi:pimeloyl-ACP methyl ester carboxylesterase
MHPERRAEWVDEMRRREEFEHTDRAYVDSLRALATGFAPGRSNVWRTVAATTTPALVVFGRKDRLIDWRTSARAESTFPDARVVVFNDLGHVAQMEAPTRVAALVLDRLAEVAARQTGRSA